MDTDTYLLYYADWVPLCCVVWLCVWSELFVCTHLNGMHACTPQWQGWVLALLLRVQLVCEWHIVIGSRVGWTVQAVGVDIRMGCLHTIILFMNTMNLLHGHMMNSITTVQICCFACAHMQTFLTVMQWKLSIKDTLNQAHLSNEDSAAPTTSSCVQIYLWIRDTSLYRTASLVQMIVYRERFHCIFLEVQMIVERFAVYIFLEVLLCINIITYTYQSWSNQGHSSIYIHMYIVLYKT